MLCFASYPTFHPRNCIICQWNRVANNLIQLQINTGEKYISFKAFFCGVSFLPLYYGMLFAFELCTFFHNNIFVSPMTVIFNMKQIHLERILAFNNRLAPTRCAAPWIRVGVHSRSAHLQWFDIIHNREEKRIQRKLNNGYGYYESLTILTESLFIMAWRNLIENYS